MSSDSLSHKAYLLRIQANTHYQIGLMHMENAKQHKRNIDSALNEMDTSGMMRDILYQGEVERQITKSHLLGIIDQMDLSGEIFAQKQKDKLFKDYEIYLAQEFSKFTVQQMNDYIKKNPACPYHVFECELYGYSPVQDAHYKCKIWQAPHNSKPQCPYHLNSWYRNQITRDINPNPSHSHANGFLRYNFIAGLDEAITSKDIQKCRQLIAPSSPAIKWISPWRNPWRNPFYKKN